MECKLRAVNGDHQMVSVACSIISTRRRCTGKKTRNLSPVHIGRGRIASALFAAVTEENKQWNRRWNMNRHLFLSLLSWACVAVWPLPQHRLFAFRKRKTRPKMENGEVFAALAIAAKDDWIVVVGRERLPARIIYLSTDFVLRDAGSRIRTAPENNIFQIVSARPGFCASDQLQYVSDSLLFSDRVSACVLIPKIIISKEKHAVLRGRWCQVLK